MLEVYIVFDQHETKIKKQEYKGRECRKTSCGANTIEGFPNKPLMESWVENNKLISNRI